MTESGLCNQHSELLSESSSVEGRKKRILLVVVLTFVTMVVEIFAGRLTGSMALEADGYHMASHVGALGLSYLTYMLSQSPAVRTRMNFGAGKVLALGGYTSAILLALIAIWMLFESLGRFLEPKSIDFNEALFVALIGLAVNVASVFLLGWNSHAHGHGHTHVHGHEHVHGHAHGHGDLHNHVEDHNHRGAVMHVLADILTSVFAVLALVIGRHSAQAVWLDAAMGVVGAVLILRWSWALLKQTSHELLDFYPAGTSVAELKQRIENDGHRVSDLHLWSQGQGALVGILTVTPANDDTDFRAYFRDLGGKLHLSVEKRPSE